jgi:predicted tellurium resistance membrane protein TerC
MTEILIAVAAFHLVFAALWTGSVLFVTGVVLPLAVDGRLDADPLGTVTDNLTTISRVSAVILLATGGHMAASRYTATTLFETGRGHLVLTMTVLWVTLIALVEIGAARLNRGTMDAKVRAPARNAQPPMRGAALVALLLLLDAGALLGM